MDIAALAGIGLAFAAIFASMILEGGNPMGIVLIPAIVLVLGGTIGASMAGGLLKDTTGIIVWLRKAFTAKITPPDAAIAILVSLAERARREGLLALEDAARGVADPFLRRGLELAVDGTDPDELREILEAEIGAKRTADRAGAKVFADMGGYAPTIGIIGTVLGLVHVLENLSQPAELGHLIASAFVATLWGVMTANVMWLPLSNRIRRISEVELAGMELVVEGILAIQAGSNPRVVAQKLRSLLPPSSRDQPAKQAEAA
ncbi:MAG: motility protein A [Actinomycetes bacterium]